MDRRQFLLAGGALLLASTKGWPGRAPAAPGAAPVVVSAFDDRDGQHCLMGADNQGGESFRLTVPERCHGGCVRPGQTQAVVFARRPGRHFYVLDSTRGQLVQQVPAGEEHHFYGHGVFSRDGRYLYATASHFPSGEGLVRVYDARRGYRHHADYPVAGTGPHELRLHPDGDTLIVALGGIRTHPDYDRVKLNLDTMAPALLLMDRHGGKIRQRWLPSHHQLSCRHLDVSADGLVIAGYQYEGPDWDNPPLLARLDTRNNDFRELTLPGPQQSSLRHYIASIAISPVQPLALVTAPRGQQALILNTDSGELLRSLSIPDAAGASAEADGSFLVSSGTGALYRIRPDRPDVDLLSRQSGHWDNHLTSLV